MKTPRLAWALLLCCACALPLAAQSGSISGTISDGSGAVVPNAKVTAQNTSTNFSRTTSTTGAGNYSLPNLSPGSYTLSIEASGFSTARFDSVALTVAQALQLNATLTPGQITESVQVTATDTPAIELENAQISNVITSRKILQLPLVTRDPYNLVLLSPGSMQSNSGLGGFSVNGSRERNNNFLLDGLDNNDTSVPGIPGGLSSLNPDATEEFRVITNNFLAEYGRNTGAIVEVVTRSGTNQLKGNAYWFGRYRALAARDTFNVKGTPQDPFVRNMFGFSTGGPIRKDKTFFFVNNEWQRYRTTLTQTSVVPTADFKTGFFRFNGYQVDLRNTASANNPQRLPLDPTMQKVLSLLPNPNGEMVDDVRGLYRFPSSSRTDTASTNFRLDHRINGKHTFFGRYTYNGYRDPNNSYDEIAPGFGTISVEAQTHSIASNLTSALTPTLVNEFRAGVNRSDLPFRCTGTEALDALAHKDAVGNAVDYSVSGIVGIGCGGLGSSLAQTRRTGTWMFADSISHVRGSHNIKAGFESRFVFENGYNAFASRQSLDFSYFSTIGRPVVNINSAAACRANGNNCFGSQIQDMTASLFGLVATQSQSQYFNAQGNRTATDDRSLRQREWGAFLQDTWKLRPNLTISIGARYQYFGVPFETNGNLSNLFANPAGIAPFTFSLIGGKAGGQLYNSDLNNIEPRFGFSWDPFRRGRTSVRGGYGIFHDRVFGNLFGNVRGNPPFQQDYIDDVATTLPRLKLPPVQAPSLRVETDAFISPSLIAQDVRNPISQNWNFGVQQQFAGGIALDVAYVGSKANRIFRLVDGNPPQPALVAKLIASGIPENSLQRSALYFGDIPATNNTALYSPALIQTNGNSTYHSLQVKATRRFAQGFEVDAAYTWSHAIDDSSDPLEATAGNRSFPRNSLDLNQERGNSGFDARHRLVVDYNIELPFGKKHKLLSKGPGAWIAGGWQLAGITTFQAGQPFDIFGDRDNMHTGVNARVDLIGNPAIPSGAPRNQTGPALSAFALAPFGRIANLGRNVFTGPAFYNTDVTLIKEITHSERFRTQLRVESFNLLNRPHYALPGTSLQDTGTFGLSTSTITQSDGTSSNRQLQIALKFYF